jgi:MraZ protein
LFQGAYPYRIDDKGRLKMPAEFVHPLGSTFTLTRGDNGCLWALSQEAWENMAARMRGTALMDEGVRMLQRWFVSGAHTVSLDPQGRLIIPQLLREYAGIEHEAVVAGVDWVVEIWSKPRWDALQKGMDPLMISELARKAGI